MRLKDLHKSCVDIGMQYDIRDPGRIERKLKEKNDEYKSLSEEERLFFDRERLWNPYHDTRILSGKETDKVKHLFVGIDVEVQQIIIASMLREKGEKIDCLFLHHPQGRAAVEIAEDMYLQIDLYGKYGVPEVQVEHQIEEKVQTTKRSSHSENIFEWQKSAELLGFSAMCCHTPADNLVYQYLEKGLARREYDTMAEVKNAFLEIDEFRRYAKEGLGPLLINCDENSRVGRIALTGINGGTDGPAVFIREQAEAGVGTIVMMHASEKMQQKASEHDVNIIQLNHYAGDDLGMNLMLDLLRREDPTLTVFPGCGFFRVERSKKELAVLDNPSKGEKTKKK